MDLRGVLPFAAGAAVGTAAGIFGRLAAQTAVANRPGLPEMTVTDAALAGHGTDWLFYHYPGGMLVLSAVVGAAVVGALVDL